METCLQFLTFLPIAAGKHQQNRSSVKYNSFHDIKIRFFMERIIIFAMDSNGGMVCRVFGEKTGPFSAVDQGAVNILPQPSLKLQCKE